MRLGPDTRFRRRVLWMGLGVGSLLWVASALLLAYLFPGTTVAEHLFIPVAHPLTFFFRLLVVLVVVGMGLYGQWVADIFSRERELYFSAMEAAAEPFVVYDLEGRVVYVNPAFTRVFGWSAEEVRGKRLDFVPEDEWPESYRIIQEVLATGGSYLGYEGQRYTASGKLIDVSISLAAYRDPQGKVAGIVVHLRNISDRKETERRLQEQRRLLQDIMDNSPALIYLKDSQGRYLLVNRLFEDLFGKPRREIVGKTDYDLFSRQEADAFRWNDRQVMATGQPVAVEEKATGEKGRRTYLSVKFPLRDAQGNIYGSGGVSIDITQRVEIERKLKERDVLSRALLESIPDPLTISRMADGRYIMVSPSFCSLLGFSPDEVVGRTPKELGLFADKEVARRMVRTLQEKGEVTSFELPVRTKDGRLLHLLVSVRPFVYQGELCAISASKDITEVRRLAEERSLLEAQLFQAQKLEALGILASGVAHDFNNLLQAAQGYAYLLSLEKDPERRSHYQQQLAQVLERGSEVVQRLLTFGRKVEPARRRVELNRVVLQALNLLERTIPKMIQLEPELGEDLPPVFGDPGQLEQVLVNLVTNAVDAMGEEGHLMVRTFLTDPKHGPQRLPQELEPRPYLVLEVCDTGCGMDQQTLDRIFEPFFTTKEVGKGTGLGLSTVYGIVKAHGGTVTCHSQLGEGSTFRVYLPVMSADQEAQEPTPLPAPRGEPRGHGETILVVDDEPTILEIASQALLHAGYQVFTASSGEEALRLFQEKRPQIQLVVLDLGMPGMGGKRCLEELRHLDAEVRVIVASGYSENGMVKEVMDQRAVDYLPKPYRLSELLQKVHDCLSPGAGES